jgi:hypothetical protein
MVLYLCVLIVFSLHRELLKLILVTDPIPRWFYHSLMPMTRPEQTWWEKMLAKEEGGSHGDNNGEEVSKVTMTRGEDNPGSGDRNPESGNHNPASRTCHPELGNRNPDSGNSNPSKENDRQGEEPVAMDINMSFTIPVEFRALMKDVVELALGAEHAMFEKPENPGMHMKPLFIRGHLDGMPIGHMLIDGGAGVNILSLSLFMKLAMSKVILNVQILALAVLQVIQRRQKE